MTTSKPRMVLKFLRLFFYRIVKRRWYLPGTPEITPEELFDRINNNQTPLIVDTRDKDEYAGAEGAYRTTGHIPDAKSIPIWVLPEKLKDLEEFKEKEVVTLCPGGGMSLVAVEIMEKAGFKDVKSLKGGIWAWEKKGYPIVKGADTSWGEEESNKETLKNKTTMKEGTLPLDGEFDGEIHNTVDARGFACPVPVLHSKKAMKGLEIGQVLEILATDPGSKRDIPAWAFATGQELIVSEDREPKEYRYLVKKLK